MNYKFADDDQLGKVVSAVRPFCKLTKEMPIPTEKDIVGDFNDPNKYPGLAGRKWSRLCGFTFKSALNGQIFQFVYVPKLKGTLSRNQRALSGWYCWTIFSKDKDLKQVTSIDQVLSTFNFSINKFVFSDLFDKYVAMFKANVSYALSNQVQSLLDQKDQVNDYNELVRYVNAVKGSIEKIDEVKQYVRPETKYDDDDAPAYARGSAPKVGHAKIAYNADKTYDLRNLDKATQRKALLTKKVEDQTDDAGK